MTPNPWPSLPSPCSGRLCGLQRNSRCPSCSITKEVYGIRCELSPDFTRGNAGMVFYSLNLDTAGTGEKVLALAAQHGMEDFYAEKYLNTLRVGAETESNELFDKSHGFYIAVIQGFFRDYYYTRGSAFSFLAEEKPEYARYFTSWGQVTPVSFPNPMQNRISPKLLLRCISVLRIRFCSFSKT